MTSQIFSELILDSPPASGQGESDLDGFFDIPSQPQREDTLVVSLSDLNAEEKEEEEEEEERLQIDVAAGDTLFMASAEPMCEGAFQEPATSPCGKRKVGRKRKFTPEEDELILRLVSQHGEANWSIIAAQMQGKNRKQLRDHYVNFLKSQVSEDRFSPAEDAAMLELMRRYGRAWNTIARLMPGRSPISIKNRYYSKLRRVVKLQARNGKYTDKEERTSVDTTTRERKSRRTCSTAGSERGSAKAEGEGTVAGKDQLTILRRQKEELQRAFDQVTQRIGTIQLSYQDS